MSSTSETKSRPTIHSEGYDIINKVIQLFDQEKSSGNFKLTTETATARAAAEMGKSEATICKIRKETTMASIDREKLKSPGKTHKPSSSSKRIKLHEFDFCVIRQTIHNFYVVKKEAPTLKNVLSTLKEEIQFPGGKEFLRKVLKKIGIKFKKCKNRRSFLMERNYTVAEGNLSEKSEEK
jgi:transposase